MKSFALLIFLLTIISCGQFSMKPKSQRDTIAEHNFRVQQDSIRKKGVDSLVNNYFLETSKSPDCLRGKDSAIAEAKKGKYYYTVKGTVYADDFEMFFSDYVERKYHVIMRANCVPGYYTEESCFEDAANEEVQRKYGEDFYERTRKEADQLFKKKEDGKKK